jgi:hypothetical protein
MNRFLCVPVKIKVQFAACFLLALFFGNACGQFTALEKSASLTSGASSNLEQGASHTFACKAPGTISSSDMRPLTKYEYDHVLVDLVGNPVVTSIASTNATFPDDAAQLGFDSVGRTLSDQQIAAYFGIAEAAASQIVSDPGILQSLAGACSLLDPATDACVESFIRNFGLRAFRRPLSATEIDDLKALYAQRTSQDSRSGFRMLFMTFLQSPQFTYHVETEGLVLRSQGDLVLLSEYELASRLSFLIWGTMPDEALLNAAAAHSLINGSALETQVERMLVDAKAKSHFHHFTHQWLKLDNTPQLNYSASFLGGIDASNLRSQMITEVDDLMDYLVWNKQGNYQDLMTTNLVFPRHPELAQVYQSAVWDGVSAPVTTSDANRQGLLTRAALLASGSDTTHPILRGAFIRRSILCDTIQSPDPASLPAGSLDLPPLQPGLSTRDLYQQKTAAVQCMQCHGQINPLGFALSGFDSIGRSQSHDSLFQNGVLIGSPVINSLVENVEITPAHSQTISGGRELGAAIVASEKGSACLVTQFGRFIQGRAETPEDGCFLKKMDDTLNSSGGSLREMIRKSALSFELRQRRLAQ